jgi:hypothetical protein
MDLLSYCTFLTKSNASSVGLQKILSLLEAEDADVRIHAVKVVANLAAEGFFLPTLFFNFFIWTLPTYSELC